MELTMELDDFKNAWQTLDRRLQQQNALNFQLLRSHRVDAMRRGFRPLVIGQAIGMLVGVAAMLALLPLLTDKDTKAFAPAWDDEIVKGALITRGGAIVHPSLAPASAA